MKHLLLRCLMAVGAMLTVLCSGPAAALNPTLQLEDFNRTLWTYKDGAPSDIKTMAQTPDGWLWLGTPTGLYRYDGVRFERYPLRAGGADLSGRINNLIARPNGDLWIGHNLGSLAVLHGNGALDLVLTEHTSFGTIRSLVFDSDGSMWATANNGLYHFEHGKWTKMGASQGLPDVAWASALLDQYQRLWIADSKGVFLLDRGGAGRPPRFIPYGISSEDCTLLQSPDGRLWVLQNEKLTLVPAPPPPDGRALPRPAYVSQAESHWGQFDRDGNLWGLYCGSGVCLIRGAGARLETTLLPAGVTGDARQQAVLRSANGNDNVLEDMEGNIWHANKNGLERIRENKLTPLRLPLPVRTLSLGSDTEGQLWAVEAHSETLWRIPAEGPAVAVAAPPYMTVATARDGALLLAGRRSIERRYHGRVEQIALPPGPDGKLIDLHVVGMLDDGKVLWILAPETGLMGYVDSHWLPRAAFKLPPKIMSSALGAAAGQLWLAALDGLYFYDNGKLSRYDNIPDMGLVNSISAGPELLVGAERGLAVLQNQRLRLLTAADPEVLHHISGVAVTPDGDRWLNGGKGLLHVRLADWRKAMDQPGTPLVYSLIDSKEGYTGYAMLENRLPSAYTAADGQLWFNTSAGLLRLDPHRLADNRVAPTAAILAIHNGAHSLAAQAGLRLPPASRNFSIQFTAPSLRQPEGVRFQYQLQGLDTEWQDAGARRIAYYTNVGPGAYRFRVKAINEDGVASAAEATLDFEVEPTFMQTPWFTALLALAAAAGLYALYRYRLYVVTSRMAERLTVRLAERERIARTLHDSFLQSVMALILRVDCIARDLPADSEARKHLLLVLDAASDTIAEGRDRVRELRSAAPDDVAGAARETASLMAATHPGIRFALDVKGTPEKLQLQAAEELSEIVREALRNAYRHAQASHIIVTLDYGERQLALNVADDGKGLPAAAVQTPGDTQREQRWGLVGMRERAVRVGAVLDISSPAGTTVRLTLPAHLAYADRQSSWPRLVHWLHRLRWPARR